MGKQSNATTNAQCMGTAMTEVAKSGERVDEQPCQPYLKVFGTDIGVLEFELREAVVTVGRSNDADIILPHPSVSRDHARICRDGAEFVLVDDHSTCGTHVNGQRTERRALRHGDTIQIATYVLQFRSHRVRHGAEEAAAQARKLLGQEFNTLPANMRARYRTLALAQPSPFRSGDTMKIGRSGVLISAPAPPDDDVCLELHLSMTSRVSRPYLGEILGVVGGGGTSWMCVKLHTLPKSAYERIVAGATFGTWVEIDAT